MGKIMKKVTKNQIKQAEVTDYLDLKSAKQWLFWYVLGAFAFVPLSYEYFLNPKRNMVFIIGDLLFLAIYLPGLIKVYKKYRDLSAEAKEAKSKNKIS
jgi:hypothetical protein